MNRSFELLNHLHNRKSHFSELPFHVETLLYKVSSEEILYPAEKVRDLGVMVSSDLNWSKQIGNMVKKAPKMRTKISPLDEVPGLRT